MPTTTSSTTEKVAAKGKIDTKRTTLLALVALTTCYQLVFHIMASKQLQGPEAAWSCQEGSSARWAVGPGQCTELSLFQRWHKEDEDETFGAMDTANEVPVGFGPDAGTAGLSTREETKSLAWSQARRSPSTQEAVAISGTRTTPESVTPTLNVAPASASESVRLRERLDRRMQSLEDAHRQLAHQVNRTAEEASLLERIVALGREMCEDIRRKGRPSCDQFQRAEVAPPEEAHLSWAASLSAVQAKLEERIAMARNRHHGQKHQSNATRLLAERASRAARLEAKLAELALGRKAWELSFVHRIEAVGREFCADLRRQGYPSCAQFLGSGDPLHVAQLPKTRAHPSVADVQSTARKTTSKSASLRLSWPPPTAEEGGNSTSARRLRPHREEEAVVVPIEELRRAFWAASAPMVACVAAIPATVAARRELAATVDSFRLQTYEGPRQLILVYHADDHESATLTRRFADGSYIKAVAARGDALPSTTALRYGAWASDADVIARWDLGDWQHPDRLALQTRSLGLARRSGSLLRRPAAGGSPGAWAEGSLVGEREWMARHWFPLLGAEGASFAAHASHLALLDAPQLVVARPPSGDAAHAAPALPVSRGAA